MNSIQYVERKTGQVLTEKVAGESALRFTLDHPLGRGLLEAVVRKPWFSRLYGLWQDSSLSRGSIRSFAEDLKIDLNEAEEPVGGYRSFNDFFARKLKPQSRLLAEGEGTLLSPADGRLLVLPEIGEKQVFHIKGIDFSLYRFLQDEAWIRRYQGGSLIIVRLCPADYHRYHFPCGGYATISRRIAGYLYSVNPLAFRRYPGLFAENERQLMEIQSPVFGNVLMAEIGAAMVGKIVQTYQAGVQVRRGEEKGYFKFGASTVILLTEPGRIVWDPDLVENSEKGLETLVRMGEGIGHLA